MGLNFTLLDYNQNIRSCKTKRRCQVSVVLEFSIMFNIRFLIQQVNVAFDVKPYVFVTKDIHIYMTERT